MDSWSDFETARSILSDCHTFAVIGLSSDPSRPSYGVARYLIANGFTVIPVNPNEAEVLGLKSYPDLESIPGDVEVDVVDIFRRSEEVAPHVDEAIERGAKAIWMQLGVIDESAAERAQRAGLRVVMDRCPAIDHPRMVAAGR